MLDQVLLGSREEFYSAGLGWAIGQLLIGQVLDVLNIDHFTFDREDWNPKSADWLYDTEVRVPEGHEGQRGRIDLTIHFKSKLVAAIEIKTREYGGHDAGKHRGYGKWVNAQPGGSQADKIFIAIADLESELHGFRFMPWADVTAGLRKYARWIIRKKPHPQAAIYLAFIAAVEQNLLGFGPPADLSLEAAARQADHLRTILQNSP